MAQPRSMKCGYGIRKISLKKNVHANIVHMNFIEESFGVWVRVVISRLGNDLVIHCDIFRKNYLGT